MYALIRPSATPSFGGQASPAGRGQGERDLLLVFRELRLPIIGIPETALSMQATGIPEKSFRSVSS